MYSRFFFPRVTRIFSRSWLLMKIKAAAANYEIGILHFTGQMLNVHRWYADSGAFYGFGRLKTKEIFVLFAKGPHVITALIDARGKISLQKCNL